MGLSNKEAPGLGESTRVIHPKKFSFAFIYQIDSMKGVDAMGYASGLLTNITFWQMVKGEKILFFFSLIPFSVRIHLTN